MGDRQAFLENSLIVGAHADDEMLWFNSIVRDVDGIIIVFRDFWAQPGLGEARRAALANYPRAGISCLGIDESGAIGCADWSYPEPTEDGIVLGFEASRRELVRTARRTIGKVLSAQRTKVAPDSVNNLYRRNYVAIRDALEPQLRPDMNVFTHNPWGEYGHEEHVQVFRVLDELRGKIGFRLWMSNYCTERALPLAMRYFEPAPGGYFRLPTDKAFADEIASVYKKHGCWTWAEDWAWFDEECFMEAPRAENGRTAHSHLFPLNFFTIDGLAPAGRGAGS